VRIYVAGREGKAVGVPDAEPINLTKNPLCIAALPLPVPAAAENFREPMCTQTLDRFNTCIVQHTHSLLQSQLAHLSSTW
jgi:hypothetical protein